MIALSIFASIATVTGTFTYAYPETLKAIRAPLIVVHDISGDLSLVAAVVYLWIHLKRTWKLGKLALSWWTGLSTATLLSMVGATGIYGQIVEMPWGSWPATMHIVGGIAVIALACFHGAYGLRRRIR